MLFIYLFLLLSRRHVSNTPIGIESPVTDINLDSLGLDFLYERGFLKVLKSNSEIGETVNPEIIIAALKRFQSFAGIEESGKFDEKTKQFMDTPRCGRPDIETVEESKRRRRFVAQGSKWRKSLVTWALEGAKNNDGISNYDVRRIFRLSLDKWQAVTNIGFSELVGQPDDSADIRVLFGAKKHPTCNYAFDGKGGTLAHAFYPLNNYGLSGDVHYDDDESFTIQSDPARGELKLLWITVHELGHSLGLAHSSKRGAIMYPYYQNFVGVDFNLTDDDILGIQSVYGVKKTPTVAPKTTPVPLPTPEPKRECTDVLQAAYLDDSATLNIFNSNKHYILDNIKGGVKNGPYKISYHFENIDFVDTVFRRHNDEYQVVFHGSTFSVHNGRTRIDAPRKINDGFQMLNIDVKKVDAAIIWPNNRKLYIFIGEDYWGMTQLSSLDYIADFGYPKKINANWRGLPNTIDAAFQWINKQVYFTKGVYYYRWNKRLGEVNSGYPQKLTRSFLKCHTA